MVWLRIDYNGKPGFDAFVTDINLGRTRVSYAMPAFPKPEEWVHLALAWDENRGLRFYVNGKFVAEAAATGMFNATLDQFGPHSRTISPVQVQSAYNFDRGGDIDEIRIYDRMLSDDNIAGLARNQTPRDIPALARNLSSQDWQSEWWFRYGWNRPGDVPPPLAERYTTVRKVEIHDAYDLKRWWWRATDAYARPPGRAYTIAPVCPGATTISSFRIGTATRSPAKPSPSSCPRNPGTTWRSRAAPGGI